LSSYHSDKHPNPWTNECWNTAPMEKLGNHHTALRVGPKTFWEIPPVMSRHQNDTSPTKCARKCRGCPVVGLWRRSRRPADVAPFTISPSRLAGPAHVGHRRGTRRSSVAAHRGGEWRVAGTECRDQGRGARNRSAASKSPAPIPLGGLRRLILGHASAREMRASAPNQP